MPIYEYGCDNCGTIEVTQRITDKPLKRCPNCKGKVSKLISTTSFQLKGSGWYVTDYAGKDGKQAKDESKPEGKSEPAAASSASSDTASEAANDTKARKDTKASSTKSEPKTAATAA